MTSTDFLTVVREFFPAVLVFDSVRYLLFACLMAAIVWLVRLTAWRRFTLQTRRPTWGDYAREFLTSSRTVIVYGVVLTVTEWAINKGWFAGHIVEPVGVVPQLICLVALLVAHDAYFYWTHRAMHTRALYKVFHRTHHLSVAPTPFAAYAFSVPEAVVQIMFVPLWLVLIPTPNLALFLFALIQIIRNVVLHSGVELHPRFMANNRILWSFTTTTHHDMHHSGNFKNNFGLYFSWWDRMMGTEHPEYKKRFLEIRGDAPSSLGRSMSLRSE